MNYLLLLTLHSRKRGEEPLFTYTHIHNKIFEYCTHPILLNTSFYYGHESTWYFKPIIYSVFSMPSYRYFNSTTTQHDMGAYVRKGSREMCSCYIILCNFYGLLTIVVCWFSYKNHFFLKNRRPD